MPKPNTRPAIFPQLKFVTNYLLAGCGPERDLIFELNTDAAVGLLVLFVVPTADDIVQAFFDPRKGRTSTPRRHGRKRPLPQGIPRVGYLVGDVWEVDSIGKGLQKLPGGRWLLPGINIYEGIALSAAVLEGVSDLAYDNFAGLLDLNPNYCREFSRFRRAVCWGDECPSPGYNGPQIIGGAGGANDPIVFRKQLGNTGFMTDSIVQKNVETAWALSCEVLIKGFDDNFPLTGSVAIETDRRGIIAQSDTFTLKKADTRAVAIDAVIEPNEFASLHWLGVAGFGNVLSGAMLGYGQSGWLDWLDKL